MVVQKTVSIREDQQQWIREHHLFFSKFIQDKLDELIRENSTTQKQEARDDNPDKGD